MKWFLLLRLVTIQNEVIDIAFGPSNSKEACLYSKELLEKIVNIEGQLVETSASCISQ